MFNALFIIRDEKLIGVEDALRDSTERNSRNKC